MYISLKKQVKKQGISIKSERRLSKIERKACLSIALKKPWTKKL